MTPAQAREHLISTLTAHGWRLAATRAHCVEYRDRSGQWIEVWDNGDAAIGFSLVRVSVTTYERMADRVIEHATRQERTNT